MSDFLTRLVGRSFGLLPTIRPATPSLFARRGIAPVAGPPGLAEEEVEFEAEAGHPGRGRQEAWAPANPQRAMGRELAAPVPEEPWGRVAEESASTLRRSPAAPRSAPQVEKGRPAGPSAPPSPGGVRPAPVLRNASSAPLFETGPTAPPGPASPTDTEAASVTVEPLVPSPVPPVSSRPRCP